MNKTVLNYSWNQLRIDVKNLSEKIGRNRFKFILAITKGGIIPAYYLADTLGIKVIKTICLSSYRGGDTVRGPIIHHKVKGFLETIENPKDWLVVDDMSDSGHTLQYIKREYPRIETAVLIQKRTGGVKANFYAREVDNIQVRMPFEK